MIKRLLPIIFLFLFSCSGLIPKKRVKIGIDPTFITSPVGKKQLQVYAFTEELIEEIFKGTRYSITLKEQSYDYMVQSIENNSTDLIISSLPILYKTKVDFTFSSMFLSLGDVLVTRKGIRAGNISDFAGKIIAIQDGQHLLPLFQPFPEVNITYYEIIPQVLEDIASQKVDGALIPYISLSSYLSEEYRRLLKISTNKMTGRGLRLVSKKNKQNAVLKIFNSRLAALIEDGTYEKLIAKWNLIL